jgi:hypothetical protein
MPDYVSFAFPLIFTLILNLLELLNYLAYLLLIVIIFFRLINHKSGIKTSACGNHISLAVAHNLDIHCCHLGNNKIYVATIKTNKFTIAYNIRTHRYMAF